MAWYGINGPTWQKVVKCGSYPVSVCLVSFYKSLIYPPELLQSRDSNLTFSTKLSSLGFVVSFQDNLKPSFFLRSSASNHEKQSFHFDGVGEIYMYSALTSLQPGQSGGFWYQHSSNPMNIQQAFVCILLTSIHAAWNE